MCGVTFGYFESASDVFPPQISSFDSAIMLKINPEILNPAFNTIFTTATYFGSTLAIALFGIGLHVIGYKREGILVLASTVIDAVIVAPLKVIVHTRILTIYEVIPLVKVSRISFPSGHSERAFTLASVLSNGRARRVL